MSEKKWECNFFIGIGGLHVNYWPAEFQWFLQQIGQDSSIYILGVIFG